MISHQMMTQLLGKKRNTLAKVHIQNAKGVAMQMKRQWLLCIGMAVAVLTSLSGCGQRVDAEPPVAEIVPKIDTLFGEERIDNYFWLRERDNPEVIAYLEAENAYTEAVMKHTEDFQEKLYQEIKGRIKETDLSVPYRKGDYYYYSRTEEGKQYDIYCRKQGSLEGAEEILLDVNVLAEGKDFMDVRGYSVSPDHSTLVYGTDEKGAER